MYQEFKMGKVGLHLDLECHNHFQEVRRQLDMHREKLKERVDDIYMEMIEKTKEFEASHLKSLKEKLKTSVKLLEKTKSTIENELKEMEETFRNPNLLIESIKEMHLKQQEAIQIIQLKSIEMNKIKDDLKVSNKFIPNESFDKDSFGQLYLNKNKYSTADPFKSSILKGQQSNDLIKLCEFDTNQKWKLLYRASEHGFGAHNFHSKCNGHAKTLSIFKVKETEFIFGAFTTTCWDGLNQYKSDENAFLFSLTNKDNKPCKMKIKAKKCQYAIYCDSSLGPTFGANRDICIHFNTNTTVDSYSRLGSTYKHPHYDVDTHEANTFLAGSYFFQLSEIEVYQKE